MRRTLVVAALAALTMLAVVAVSSALATPSHKKHDRTLTIHVVEHATSDVVVDNAPADDSVGDTLAFGNDVYDATDTAKVGTDGGSCTRTVVGVSWECMWTVSLADGQITVEGPFLDAGDSTLAITGGTGAYRNASGEMDLHARDAQGSAYDFVYHVSGAQRR